MKERPILFNTAMLQAILAGRKTQTRRLLKPCKDANFNCELALHEIAGEINAGDFSNSKVGQPGDRLWVRETFGDCGARLTYKADADDGAHCMVKRWIPSIHMPRWACRIILEITGLRVERLQDISESDAADEGLDKPVYVQNESGQLTPPPGETLLSAFPTAKHWFSTVWDGVYGNWSANPWVWVIEFKVLTTNGMVPEVAA